MDGQPDNPHRPPLLAPATNCELWLGEATGGNDPTIRLSARLCPRGARITGEVQWSSLTSGWNERSIEGSWVGDQLILKDLAVVAEAPNPGWRFCTIDAYTLNRQGAAELVGQYTSAMCRDQADVHLTLQDSESTVLSPPEPPAVETPAEEADRRTPGCQAIPAGGGLLWLVALGVGLRRRNH